jgi:hypothetical protein
VVIVEGEWEENCCVQQVEGLVIIVWKEWKENGKIIVVYRR